MKSLLVILFVAVVVTGCTNRGFYESSQISRRNECRKLPIPQQEKCLEAASKTFEQYERERQEVLDE